MSDLKDDRKWEVHINYNKYKFITHTGDTCRDREAYLRLNSPKPTNRLPCMISPGSTSQRLMKKTIEFRQNLENKCQVHKISFSFVINL